jgi:hypothetical protein
MIKRLLAPVATATLLGALLAAAPARAAVIDMEGIAPPSGVTSEFNTTRNINGFNVFSVHGHYWDSAGPGVGGARPDNGTDFFLHDDSNALVVTKAGGGGFSIQSFDATFYDASFNGNANLNHVINVTGLLDGGGSIGASFAVDDIHAFETFLFGAGWENVTQVSFVNSAGLMAYDNIVVDAPAAVPAPAALAAFGFGLAGMAALRRRRRA